MPAESEHVNLAVHNIETVAFLLTDSRFSDWAATVAFYAALHIIEAIFYVNEKDAQNKHGQKHERREGMLKHHHYSNLWKHYRELQSASTIARYMQGPGGKACLFRIYMPPEKVKEILIGRHLGQLIKSAKKFIPNSITGIETAFAKCA
jgi:hypothetical protein